MEIQQWSWPVAAAATPPELRGAERAQVVLVFGARGALEDAETVARIRAGFPAARVAFCSTAGEIAGTRVLDESIVVTAVTFRTVEVAAAEQPIAGPAESVEVGRRLAADLEPEGLAHVFVLSDGLHVNGTALIQGLTEGLPPGVVVTGGLSGDAGRFERTLVGIDAAPTEKRVVALGFYGDRLRVGFGSLGGWDPFGPERTITRASGNILYEMDGTSALELYKRYLGEHASQLPASGLLFPLFLRTEEGGGVVRTLLAVDEEEQSMTFAGDVPEGAKARLMKANFDRLIDGAGTAAGASRRSLRDADPELAILVSCVGRKMVLKQRTEEEVEGVREVVGGGAVLAGFYSYGEISPGVESGRCELHNQTMTITTFAEV